MTPPVALWLPFEVADLTAATSFYTNHIGLTPTDSWHHADEQGVVLHAGAAYVELVSPAHRTTTPSLAFEYLTQSEVDRRHARLHAPTRPHQYPRGHYGFETQGPANTTVMLWSERP